MRQGLAENLSYAERIADSIVEYEKALNLKPEDPVVHAGLVWQCIWEETALTWSQHRIKDEKLLKKDIEGLKNAENWNHRMLFMITL